MKTFEIITEADARVLDIGSSVTLKPGGHVTPLAADTLKARRITVLSGVAEASLDGLAPVADIKSIAIGSDHSGVALKARLRDHLRQRGLSVGCKAPRNPYSAVTHAVRHLPLPCHSG